MKYIFKIKDLCKVGDGAHASIKRTESGVMYLTSKNFKSTGLDLTKVDFINEKDFEKHFSSKSNAITKPIPGDIVFGIIGSIGTPYVVRPNDFFGLSSSVAILRPDKELDSGYLYYYMLSSAFQMAVDAIKSGVAQGFLSLEMIKSLPLIIHPLPVQRKIAGILSAYDDLIENNKRRIALLEKMAEEIYREWFVRMRFPGHESTKFEKGLPVDWEKTTLGKQVNIVMGQSPSSEFYNQAGNGLPFHQGVGTFGSRFPITETYCSVDGRFAEDGDILFSVRAPVGRINIADQKIIIGRGLSALNHRKNCNSYLFYLLKLAFSREDIIGNGSIFNSVTKQELMNFPLFDIPQELVTKFELVVSQIDKQIETFFKLNINLIKTRDRLLPRLISGKLSVENLDIQSPPSMLE